MRKILIISLFILSFTEPLWAMAIGGPDISIPEKGLYTKKDEAVKAALDRYEYNMNVKAAAEVDVIFERKLTSAPADVLNLKLEGQNFGVKISDNFYNNFEPYIKIGTSNLEVKWDQHGNDVKVEANPGFVWGYGAKVKLFEAKDYGVRLTLDGQYRTLDFTVDKATLNASSTIASSTDETFKIRDWQISLLGSKRYIFPIGKKDYYIVPYTGITFSSADVDVSFTQSTSGLLYSTYNASDDNVIGVVIGCDVMNSLLSYYLLNFELRLLNETAFTIGGTIKF